MQWTSSVPEALSAARSLQTPLLVLVEPALDVQTPRDPSSESAKDLYSRVASRALHKYLFANANVLEIIRLTNLQCLRFPCEITNKDFLGFSAFFTVELPAPNLFIINPNTGEVLNRFKGYVSFTTFRESVSAAIKTVSDSDIVLPQNTQIDSTKKTLPSPTKDTGSTSSVPTGDSVLGSSGSSLHPKASKDSSKKDLSESDNSSVAVEPSQNFHVESGATSSKKSLKLPRTVADCQLRARLPDGQQIERMFKSDSRFASVRSWLSEEAKQNPARLTVATIFPRYVFSLADDAKFLSELSLCPSANLIVSPAPKIAGSGDESGAGPTTADNTNQPNGQERPWRIVGLASGVVSLLSGLVRTTIAGAETVTTQANAASSNGNSTTEAHGAPLGRGRAVRMTERRSSRDSLDDGQWMSNGNSTQFGWNPKDSDDNDR